MSAPRLSGRRHYGASVRAWLAEGATEAEALALVDAGQVAVPGTGPRYTAAEVVGVVRAVAAMPALPGIDPWVGILPGHDRYDASAAALRKVRPDITDTEVRTLLALGVPDAGAAFALHDLITVYRAAVHGTTTEEGSST